MLLRVHERGEGETGRHRMRTIRVPATAKRQGRCNSSELRVVVNHLVAAAAVAEKQGRQATAWELLLEAMALEQQLTA